MAGGHWREMLCQHCSLCPPQHPLLPAAADRTCQELDSGSDGHGLLLYACVLLTKQSLLKLQQASNYFSS